MGLALTAAPQLAEGSPSDQSRFHLARINFDLWRMKSDLGRIDFDLGRINFDLARMNFNLARTKIGLRRVKFALRRMDSRIELTTFAPKGMSSVFRRINFELRSQFIWVPESARSARQRKAWGANPRIAVPKKGSSPRSGRQIWSAVASAARHRFG